MSFKCIKCNKDLKNRRDVEKHLKMTCRMTQEEELIVLKRCFICGSETFDPEQPEHHTCHPYFLNKEQQYQNNLETIKKLEKKIEEEKQKCNESICEIIKNSLNENLSSLKPMFIKNQNVLNIIEKYMSKLNDQKDTTKVNDKKSDTKIDDIEDKKDIPKVNIKMDEKKNT